MFKYILHIKQFNKVYKEESKVLVELVLLSPLFLKKGVDENVWRKEKGRYLY